MTTYHIPPFIPLFCLQVTTYHIYMALQSECHVTVTGSRQHQLSPDSATPVEILTLRVDSTNPTVRAFDIRYCCVLVLPLLCTSVGQQLTASSANVITYISLRRETFSW